MKNIIFLSVALTSLFCVVVSGIDNDLRLYLVGIFLILPTALMSIFKYEIFK